MGDVYCKTLDEVFKEISRRKKARVDLDDLITKYERSPYGGYRVYSIPADIIADELVDPTLPNTKRDTFRLYR